MEESMIEFVNRIYLSPEFQTGFLGKYELILLQGVKNDIAWVNLDDEQKLAFRKADLIHKRKLSGIFSDLVLQYEDAVVELGLEILNFLKQTKTRFSNLEEIPFMPKAEIAIFRLRNMLYCELYSINKHKKLEQGGHVLYTEVIEPIIHEVENQILHPTYDLSSIKELYKAVVDLYGQNPYQKEG